MPISVSYTHLNYPGLDNTWYRTAVRTPEENEKLLKIMREVLK